MLSTHREVRVTSMEQSSSPTRSTVPVAQFAVFVVMKVLMSAVLGWLPSRLTAGRRRYPAVENVDWRAPELSRRSPFCRLTSTDDEAVGRHLDVLA